MNVEAQLAEQFALETNATFFLTGKAGTGKTTFLKTLLTKAMKNTVVVAPTGVAAINAGGVTIHSMFGLPLKAFAPNNDFTDPNIMLNRNLLSKHLRYRKDKRKLLQELETLIIDEISMVRADILDAIDFALRFVRKNPTPFGGVQLIVIGDLYQLSPIVRDDIRPAINEYYESPYFFSAYAWKEVHPITIELQKIYRQQDPTFINILNNIRNGNMKEKDVVLLNEHYDPKFQPKEKDYITLTTHNRIADDINNRELEKLPSTLYRFLASVEGTFNENSYPVEEVLRLKEGAQIMFTRNDSEGGRYFNGKLAEVINISSDFVEVKFKDTGHIFTLTKEVWENKTYKLNPETNEVEEEVIGSFRHFPVRLAWAITIHKSQGLTFEKAIVDVGKSFAAGQTYVALSRCTSLEGMVLTSKINTKNVFVDQRIVAFHKNMIEADELKRCLEDAQADYAIYSIRKLFDFNKLKFSVLDWQEVFEKKELPNMAEILVLNRTLIEKCNEILDVQSKFDHQLNKLLRQYIAKLKNPDLLIERCRKAIEYYAELIYHGLIIKVHKHLNEFAYKKGAKLYLLAVDDMYQTFWRKLENLYEGKLMSYELYPEGKRYHKEALPLKAAAKPEAKKQKGQTYLDTLALYEEGKTIKEIARIRSMAVSTVESHFTKWIVQGKIDIYKVLDEERIKAISKFFDTEEPITLSGIKEQIPFETEYNELRMILAHHQNLDA